MSCYAFSKRWLLPSLLYDCHYFLTIFSLNQQLKPLLSILGCFPLDYKPQRLQSDSTKNFKRIRSFLKLSRILNPPHSKSALPHLNVFAGYTKIYFAENRLSLSLISLSLLITSHPNLLPQILVRPSIPYYYEDFSLLMIRSLSFGSYTFD